MNKRELKKRWNNLLDSMKFQLRKPAKKSPKENKPAVPHIGSEGAMQSPLSDIHL